MKQKAFTALATAAILSSAYAGTAQASTYTVQKGDSLSLIAAKYHTSVQELKSFNHLQSDFLRINQILQVAAELKTQSVTTTSQAAFSTYTVVSGDCLSKIAHQYKVTVANLKAWNSLKSDTIYIGQKLKISTGAKNSAPVTVKPATMPQVPSSKSAPASSISTATGTYTVISGDTIGKIALQFNMKAADLKKLNNLSSDLIFVGQTLKVNGTTSSSIDPTVSPQKVISIAESMIGTPYVWGGSNATGVDCSGLVYYAFKQAGMSIGRYSAAGYYDRSYDVDHPQPGDLVFFKNTYKKGISHVGIYLGNHQFIQADDTHGVMVSNLNSNYYQQHFDSFKRFY